MRVGFLFAVATVGLALASPSPAGWATTAGGSGNALATTLAAGATPIASAPSLSLTITVSWAPTPIASGYVVTRYDALGAAQAAGGTCAGTVSGLSCSETVVPGTYRYAIVPTRNGWSGSQGP